MPEIDFAELFLSDIFLVGRAASSLRNKTTPILPLLETYLWAE